MKTDFWLERWQRNEIGFHKDKANPALVNHWHTMPVDIGCRVFVPLCGKTVDVVWILRAGYQVVAAELSEVALDALADQIEGEFGLAVDKQTVDGLILYRAAGILLIGGDFFKLTARDIGPVDVIYDRAALIALPPEMRKDYAQHLMAITHSAPQLLVTVDYDRDVMDGPPFAITTSEVNDHYGATYQIDEMERREQIDEEVRFRDRGLNSMMQTVHRLVAKK